jgi:outer membrane protein assembly factor BamB
MLSGNSRVNKKQGQLTSEIDGKIVALGVDSGKYYAFDEISTDIWSRLDAQPRLADLCRALANDYDADIKTIQVDVYRLINMLAANNLIEISE